MQKINTKKMTKERIAEMYAEVKSAYDAAMDDEERRVKELSERNAELIALRAELDNVRTQLAEAENANSSKDKLLDGLCERIRAITGVRDTYRDSFRWCIDHPWRNLWRCFAWRLKGERRAS